jgi:hypothetical protein
MLGQSEESDRLFWLKLKARRRMLDAFRKEEAAHDTALIFSSFNMHC